MHIIIQQISINTTFILILTQTLIYNSKINYDMEQYKILDHTADAKFQAFGKDLNEVFTNAALAMFSILKDPKEIKAVKKFEFEIDSEDLQSLLYDFLEKFVVMMDIDDFMLSELEVEIEKLSEDFFKLNCKGKGDSSKKYEIGGDIKAVTYHDMFVKKEKGLWTIQAVVDI